MGAVSCRDEVIEDNTDTPEHAGQVLCLRTRRVGPISIPFQHTASLMAATDKTCVGRSKPRGTPFNWEGQPCRATYQ